VTGDVIDLRGRSIGAFTGALVLGSDQIATVRLPAG